MTLKKLLELGSSADGEMVTIDYDNTNLEYHLLETPGLLDLVREALPTVVLAGQTQVIVERDLGRVVGTTNLIEMTNEDEIIYAKRIGRSSYSRFAKNREPIASSSIVIVLRKGEGEYYLWTAMCGKLLPPEAYQQDSDFNATHAMAYDEKLVQVDTVTHSKPVG